MADRKIMNNVIKKLDRVIALLDNCIDSGEMGEITRMRLVEMLHTSITEIYSIGKNEQKPVPDDLVNEIVKDTEPVTNDHTEVSTIEQNPVEEIIAEITETDNDEPQDNTTEQKDGFNIDNDVFGGDGLIELENVASTDYFGNEKFENSSESTIETEQPVQQTHNTFDAEEENLAEEKAQLAELRKQLEDERNRLEEELLSWQRERLKREEEMKAAEQLLATLEAETQKRKNALINETKQVNPVVNPIPVEDKNVATPTSLPAQNNNSNTKTIGDQLSEKRETMQNSSSSEDLRRQGINPIADLTKAIGINDKFQFIKELFGGDSDKYTETIRALNNFNRLDEALVYIDKNFGWDKNNDAVKRILMLVRRRYMN